MKFRRPHYKCTLCNYQTDSGFRAMLHEQNRHGHIMIISGTRIKRKKIKGETRSESMAIHEI